MVDIVTSVPRVPMALKIDKEANRWDRHMGNKTKSVIETNTADGDTDSDLLSASWFSARPKSPGEFSSTHLYSGVQVEAMMIEKDQVPRMAFPKTTLSTNS
mmetsp:Transcript_18726/g.38583  ORF Transcript_18726/g.38583 Transcript_18726/m.38583 type:complete len:101 (+) Transcript_18726:746-1048(+)